MLVVRSKGIVSDANQDGLSVSKEKISRLRVEFSTAGLACHSVYLGLPIITVVLKGSEQQYGPSKI